MIKSKLSQNFSFKPLQKSLENLAETYYKEIGDTLAQNIKDVLMKGDGLEKVFPLSKKRIRNRSKGIWFPDSVRGSQYIPKPQNMTRPLVQTENLFNSIEAKKDGIYMARYGKVHNDGSEGMPKRPFIDVAMMFFKGTKKIKQIERKLFFEVAKLLKKGRTIEI